MLLFAATFDTDQSKGRIISQSLIKKGHGTESQEEQEAAEVFLQLLHLHRAHQHHPQEALLQARQHLRHRDPAPVLPVGQVGPGQDLAGGQRPEGQEGPAVQAGDPVQAGPDRRLQEHQVLGRAAVLLPAEGDPELQDLCEVHAVPVLRGEDCCFCDCDSG